MDNKYKVLIGLEMHCEISETNTKVFSPSKNGYTNQANNNVNQIDLALPGILPLINKEAVKKALMASIILNCKQPDYIYFERKNYYYPDLPKGFQITQETKPAPVGIYGYLEFDFNGEKRKVRVNNIHLEEDAASLDHYKDYSLIDYNRAGVPLLELVTYPDLHSSNEAITFLEATRSIYQYSGISECDSKKGQVRCDVNVSIMDKDKDETNETNWGTKIEVKNVNSFSAVKEAIEYEIKRQIELKNNNEYDNMIQQTRRWDDELKETVYMRNKVNAIDYKYFIEPNIPKFKLTEEFINSIKNNIPELPNERKIKYINEYGLTEIDASTLVKDKSVSDYYDEVVKLTNHPKETANFIITRVLGYMNKESISINDIYLNSKLLSDLINSVTTKKISTQQAKYVFTKCMEESKEPLQVIKEENMEQVSNEEEIIALVDLVLAKNDSLVLEYKSGKTNLLGFLVGQVLKESHGKFNPGLTAEIMKRQIDTNGK